MRISRSAESGRCSPGVQPEDLPGPADRPQEEGRQEARGTERYHPAA